MVSERTNEPLGPRWWWGDKRGKTTLRVIAAVSVLSVIGLALWGPVPQPQNYHSFADRRTIWGIAHFWNVISNLPFILVGIFGLVNIKAVRLREIPAATYVVLCVGALLMGLGSIYYHLAPDDQTLSVDRLGMALVFMPLVSVVVIDFVSPRVGKMLLVPLLAIGILSVLYWIGSGDLRLYILVQYLSMFIILLILIGFPSPHSKPYWMMLAAYFLAKFLEQFDAQVYDLLDVISGHSLKHIVAALGLYVLLVSYKKRP